MVEQKVPEVVAVRVDAGLLAQTGRPKKRKRLERPQRRLALGHGHRTAGHCYGKEKKETVD